jgi:molybdopterin-guanine dinucleotide biosynthesis protein MobB
LLVVAVIGKKGSGKTTTIEFLTSILSLEGYKVGAVKHVHHRGFTIDVKGKDTWKYAKAGAKEIVIVSPDEIAVIKKENGHRYTLEEILNLFDESNFDIIFLEGLHGLISKRKDVYKIIVAKAKEELKSVIKDTSNPIIAITGKVAEERNELPNLNIPILDIYKEGNELITLIKKMLNH